MMELMKMDHVGIRVRDGERSIEFYRRFGFEVIFVDPTDPVVVLRNRHEVEINLVVNGDGATGEGNVLMDEEVKHTGITHVAFNVDSAAATEEFLVANGIPITEGPVTLGHNIALFIRDPDGNVIEFNEKGAARG